MALFGQFKTITLQVEGMTCVHCVMHVQKALTSLSGVKSAKVDLKSKKAEVNYDPNKVNEKQMMDAVDAAGYKATVIA